MCGNTEGTWKLCVLGEGIRVGWNKCIKYMTSDISLYLSHSYTLTHTHTQKCCQNTFCCSDMEYFHWKMFQLNFHQNLLLLSIYFVVFCLNFIFFIFKIKYYARHQHRVENRTILPRKITQMMLLSLDFSFSYFLGWKYTHTNKKRKIIVYLSFTGTNRAQ